MLISWTNLIYFNISYNYLHSKLIFSKNLTKLVGFDVSYNDIHGDIPVDLLYMTELYEIILSHNLLTGTIPVAPSNDVSLIGIGDSSFSSSYNLTNYSYYLIDLSYNHLSGSISSHLGHMHILNTLLLNDNKFTGTLSNIFNSDIQTMLQILNCNNNDFSGSIPTDIFDLPLLNAFSISKNCLKGSIPVEICNAQYIQVLYLD